MVLHKKFLHNSKAAGIKHNNNENEWARQLYKWIVAFIIRLKKLPKPELYFISSHFISLFLKIIIKIKIISMKKKTWIIDELIAALLREY